MSFVAGDDYAEKVHHSATERHKLQAFCFASEATAEALTGICPRLQTQRVPMGTGIRTVFAYADVEALAWTTALRADTEAGAKIWIRSALRPDVIDEMLRWGLNHIRSNPCSWGVLLGRLRAAKDAHAGTDQVIRGDDLFDLPETSPALDRAREANEAATAAYNNATAAASSAPAPAPAAPAPPTPVGRDAYARMEATPWLRHMCVWDLSQQERGCDLLAWFAYNREGATLLPQPAIEALLPAALSRRPVIYH